MLIIVDYSFRHCFLLAFGGSTTSVVLDSKVFGVLAVTRRHQFVVTFDTFAVMRAARVVSSGDN